MPKLSVSVPDELWESAKRRGGAMKTSELVQTALRLYVAGGRGTSPQTEHESDRFGHIVQGLLEGYKRERGRGYEAGLTAAELMGYEGLTYFRGESARLNDLFFDEEVRDGWPRAEDYDDQADWVADAVKLREIGTKFSEGGPFSEGVVQAFMELWFKVQERLEDEFTQGLAEALGWPEGEDEEEDA